MSIDDKLTELDAILRGLRADVLAVCARSYDPDVAAMEQAVERARLIVAEVRLELGYLRERLE